MGKECIFTALLFTICVEGQMMREKKYFSKGFLLCLRLVILVYALVLLTPIASQTAQASSGDTSKNTGNVLEFHVKKIKYRVTKAATKKAKGTVTVLGLQAGYNPKSLTIPSTITYKDYNYTVNAVGNNESEIDAEYDLLYINAVFGDEVKFPDAFITEISKLLPKCEWGKKLSSVTLPSTIKTIHSFAFGECETLKEIKIPESVMKIGSYAFYKCTALKEIKFPSKVKDIHIGTLEQCTSLEKVIFPKNLEYIGQLAFSKCNKLQAVSIPATTTLIQGDAFLHCSSLRSFKVASTNKTYKSKNNALLSKNGKTLLLYPCGNNSFIVPNGVVTIDSWAFKDSSLVSLTIADSVTTIEYGAFYNCFDLKEVVMGDSVETIDQNAFFKCISLESISLPSSLRGIGLTAFNQNTSLREVKLNEGLETIRSGAFEGCTSLETITIPASVYEIEDNIFKECPKLKDIKVETGNTNYRGENGMLIRNDEAVLVAYPSAKDNVRVPGTIQYIGDYAFQGAKLTDVVIPETVVDVGSSAFLNCTSLKSVRFMSRETAICGYNKNWGFTNSSGNVFLNTADSLVITIPKEPFAPVEPVREQYASESDYIDAYYDYEMYHDEFADLLMYHSGGKATIVYQ